MTTWWPVITAGTCSPQTERLLASQDCQRAIKQQQGVVFNTIQLLIQSSCVYDPFAITFDYSNEYGSYEYGNYDYEGSVRRRKREVHSRRKRAASWFVHSEAALPSATANQTGQYKTELEYTHTRHRYPWLCSLRREHEHVCAVTLLALKPAVLVGAAHCTLQCSGEGESRMKGGSSEEGGSSEKGGRRRVPNCCCGGAGQQNCASNTTLCGTDPQVTEIPVENLEIVCGEWSIGDTAPEEDGEEFNVPMDVEEVVRHPEYDLVKGPGGGSDIAVFKVNGLESILEENSDKIYPICLPKTTRPATGIHSGWSKPPPRKFMEKYAAGFLPYYADFFKQWHYKMDIQDKCKDANVSQTFGQALANPSNSWFPGGLLCAKDFTRQSCFSTGDSGSPLMTREPGSDSYRAEGLLSFVKGCDTFTIGASNEESTEWQLTRFSENPSAYTELSCFLPWVAEQYDLEYDGPRTCSPENGDKTVNPHCTETISNLGSSEKECIFPFYYEGKKYDGCIMFDQDGFVLPVFRCPVRNITTKIDGISSFEFLDPTHGYCVNALGELDPLLECTGFQRVPPFSQCKNDCPGGKHALELFTFHFILSILSILSIF